MHLSVVVVCGPRPICYTVIQYQSNEEVQYFTPRSLPLQKNLRSVASLVNCSLDLMRIVMFPCQGLSDEKHFDDEDHNPEYDHEAFLGRDEARSYEDLTPEESKERLGFVPDCVTKWNHNSCNM